ncbi:coiled-coil domain-containing protein 65 [Anoplophora glabripennis]|uniref:coiled-coil domain-containing protein 65 n=1 Tax=Anoplophora glabripennis TaxID=217634 RepID=UPI0008757630|nr:coiled-coil domain-containing protein 65 [Anoplophora glabripennis]
MAGGKKKSAANKLAKMSDEERARYLQHKADMEEEAKRRKEQLIATFMKKKIKKEDAFSRLNLAKINQNWHQILRRAKCQEMKENVGHLKEWIDRLLNFKNLTISKLMEELEDAEGQYSNNFQYHSTHIDNIIGNKNNFSQNYQVPVIPEYQHEYIEKLQQQYDKDLCDLLEATCTENELLSRNAQIEHEHLMTILYGQQTEGKKVLTKQYECYMVQLYETEHKFKVQLSQKQNSREAMCGALWRQLATVVRLYVQQTDSRRMHLAELRGLDAESALEIAENEERMKRQESLINQLENDHDNMLFDREKTIKTLEFELGDLEKFFLRMKRNLQKDLQTDETKLFLLTDCATRSLHYLETLAKKGEQIKYLANACKRFETEREKVSKWLPITRGIAKHDEDDEEFKRSVKIVSEQLKDIENVEATFYSIQDCALPLLGRASRKKSSGRPKTAISDPFLRSAHTISSATPDSRRVTTANAVTIHTKGSREFPSSSSSQSEPSAASEESTKDILERCFESLKGMENFWFVFNKAEMDRLEIKEEKRILERENKELRGAIRAVLEAAALSQSIPNSRASTRLPSRRRAANSAPLRRVVFN